MEMTKNVEKKKEWKYIKVKNGKEKALLTLI